MRGTPMKDARFFAKFYSRSDLQSRVAKMDISTTLPKFLYKASFAGYEYNYEGYYHERRGGSCYLLAYTKSGQASLTYHGKTQTVMPGSLLFINMAEENLIEAPSTPWEIYFVHVYGSEIVEIYQKVIEKSGYYLEGFMPETFIECIKNVYKALQEGDNIDPFFVSEQLYKMLMDVLRQSRSSISVSPLVHQVAAYLNSHYQENVSIGALAAQLYVSKEFLIRKFHNDIGITPKQYLTHIRIQKARTLLVHTEMSIREVAEESGFGTEKNIFYAFKQVLGTTPTQFRDNIYSIPAETNHQ